MIASRNKEKEILLICKGHYSDKYESTYDALNAYQVGYTGCEEKYITDGNILTFILDAVKEFMQPFDYWYEFIKEGLIHDIDMAATGMIPRLYPEKEIKLSYRYLINKLASSLCSIQVRNDDGWIIDLSEYGDIKEIV